MGFRTPSIVSSKRKSSSNGGQVASTVADIPKGYLAVYVGDDESKMKRFVIPYLLSETAIIPGLAKSS